MPKQPPLQSATWSDAAGSVILWRPSAAVLRIEMARRVDEQKGAQLTTALDHYLRTGGGVIDMYWDVENLVSYPPSLRVACTDIIRQNWKHVGAINVLVGSRLIAMAAAVANLALENRLKSFTDRHAFETAYATASGAERPLRGHTG